MKRELARYFIILDEAKCQVEPERIPSWLVFLAYLAYLRAMHPQQPAELKTLRLLIVTVGLVLVVVALVAAGSSDQVGGVIQHWPLIP